MPGRRRKIGDLICSEQIDASINNKTVTRTRESVFYGEIDASACASAFHGAHGGAGLTTDVTKIEHCYGRMLPRGSDADGGPCFDYPVNGPAPGAMRITVVVGIETEPA